MPLLCKHGLPSLFALAARHYLNVDPELSFKTSNRILNDPRCRALTVLPRFKVFLAQRRGGEENCDDSFEHGKDSHDQHNEANADLELPRLQLLSRLYELLVVAVLGRFVTLWSVRIARQIW